jgi:hypothetical protein
MTPLGRSDHVAVICKPKSSQRVREYKKVEFRPITRDRKLKFGRAVVEQDWTQLVKAENNADDMAEVLAASLTSIFVWAFPTKTVRLVIGEKPWMKPSLVSLMNARDKAFAKGRHLKYIKLKEEVIRHISELKKKYYAKEQGKLSTNKQSDEDRPLAWNAVKNLLPSTRADKADHCPDAINTIFTQAHQPDNGTVMDLPDIDSASEVSLKLTESEVEKELACTKNSSPGIDLLPSWIWREFSTSLSSAVTQVFNSSLETGVYPAIFKYAVVTPIPKVKNPLAADFRPISLLPVLSKAFERLVRRKWLIPAVQGKLDPLQFAFTPGLGKGCTCALALITHKIFKFLDEASGAVRLLLVDLSKAFDCATLSTTLNALIRASVPIPLVYWLSNYMQGRRQAVRTSRGISEWTDVISGVPQGSVLGPLLFALIIDDLRPKLENSIIIKYADDITVLHFVRRQEEDRLTEEWTNIKDWCLRSQLKPNPSKTKILDIITSKSIQSCSEIEDNGIPIEKVDSVRLLGVTLSSNLKWDAHINDVTRRASRRLFSLIVLRNSGAPSKSLWDFYCAAIRSILLYAYPAWCNCGSGLWDQLNKVERRALRLAGSMKPSSLRPTADNIALNLMKKIEKNDEHPLGEMVERVEVCKTRSKKSIKAPWAKTSRLRDSLICYADKI